MIRYTLQCERSHGFDGWFRSSGDFDLQAEAGLLSCPLCGSVAIEKGLMAPAVRTAEKVAESTPVTAERAELPNSGDVALLGDKEQRLRAMIRALRDEVTKNAENVGPRFAEVARRMHEGEIEKGSVYGKASPEEIKSLAEDGIDFHPLPVLPDEGN
ncbi:DUF1178 family protein [Flaviflagellibacter deserti]|uniref:DUF1178 family protein n=1 Tax=Flaviflagellibacter deserti TaxID=2267266 RepID=A0ABV9YZU6_9HYPH